MQHDTAPAVHSSIQVFARAERCDRDRHLPFSTGREVRLEPVIRFMDDLVHGIRRGGTVRVVTVVLCQFLGDPVEPFIEKTLWPRVECGEAANNARLALRDHQVGTGNDEKRRAYNRKPKVLEDSW